MKLYVRAAVTAAAAAVVPLMFAGAAHATGPVYFAMESGTFQCSITDDGTVGCDTPPESMSMTVAGVALPIPFLVHEVVIDAPWAPAHPAFDAGTPHTLPGGNPDISTVSNGGGMWGSSISYAGATCSVGFHDSMSCESKGHTFSYYEQISGN